MQVCEDVSMRCAGHEGACGKAAERAQGQRCHVAARQGVGARLGRLELLPGFKCDESTRKEGLIRLRGL